MIRDTHVIIAIILNQWEGIILFSDVLRALREDRDVSQSTLAKALGYSRTAISAYETGRNSPSFDDLKKIASYFNVTTDYLLEFVPDTICPPQPIKLTKEQQELIDLFERLNSKGKKKLLAEAGDLADHPKFTEVEIEERQKHA